LPTAGRLLPQDRDVQPARLGRRVDAEVGREPGPQPLVLGDGPGRLRRRDVGAHQLPTGDLVVWIGSDRGRQDLLCHSGAPGTQGCLGCDMPGSAEQDGVPGTGWFGPVGRAGVLQYGTAIQHPQRP
jgi:hypothetical protein